MTEAPFLQVLLMVILRAVECFGLYDLGDDGLLEPVYFFELSLEGIG